MTCKLCGRFEEVYPDELSCDTCDEKNGKDIYPDEVYSECESVLHAKVGFAIREEE